MQHVDRLNTHTTAQADPQAAASIPKVRPQEAAELAAAELQRFLDLLATLEGNDWEQPTACTLWNVKQVVAHQAGWEAGWTGFGKAFGMFNPKLTQPYVDQGMDMLDAVNQAQVDSRAECTTTELIAEIREHGPRSIAFRRRLPGIVRALPMPDGSGGLITVGYLMNTILTRDMWMHRLDICRATGHEFVQTEAHDGRIIALVVRDLAENLKPVLGSASVIYEIQGISGGRWHIGKNPVPATTITIDVINFNLLASGRASADELQNITVNGDEAFARTVLNHTSVLY